MDMKAQVAIIGGGLAGLTAAIDLNRRGFSVLVIEKKQYPQHKVCGEYLSAEVQPYFKQLGLDLTHLQPEKVNRFRLYAPNGQFVEQQLPLGGLGIRRYALDHHLYQHAKMQGVQFLLNTQISEVQSSLEQTDLCTKKGDTISAQVVLASFGKRANLDRLLQRPFVQEAADYVGIKFYIQADFPADLVTLYNFAGGYAGAVQVEDGSIDIAYLCRARQLQEAGGISALEEQILFKNPAIRALFTSGDRYPQPPIAISNVSFLPKRQVVEGMLMVGDAAGMIPPLAGNGMAMGIHGAKLAVAATTDFLHHKLSRQQMEDQYQTQWNRTFARRLRWGRRLHQFMGRPMISDWAVRSLAVYPPLLKPIIRFTHGKPIH
ncbi:MAG TPA: NAD(P)/FAD-dependent oxidoreductase [Saprospiraceae bacterium]|nr:NAD(P)/FAD-dependent oxidoreductase [Saprospiraceae bacterium]